MKYIKDRAEFDLKTKSVVLARDGIYQYLGHELGLIGDDTVYNVKRTTKSVLKVADEINNIGVIPITIGHPKSFLDLKSDKSFKRGGVGNCYTNIIDDINVVSGQIVSINDEVKELLEMGQEVSLGSMAEILKSKSKNYDFIMDIKEVNHLAIVPSGRCGNICSVTDGFNNKDYLIEELLKMKIKKAESDKDLATSDVEAIIDARMSKLEDVVKTMSETLASFNKVADEDTTPKDEPTGEPKETTEEEPKEVQYSIEDQLKKATANGLDKGKDIAKINYEQAIQFIDKGLIKASDLIGKLPCDTIDAKLKELFALDELVAEDRAGLITLCLSDKKEYKDAWTNWGKAKEEKATEPKTKTKKRSSIFK